MRQYQIALDSALMSNPQLGRCVANCVHCGIRFLTDPRNAGREDLRCPFGCRRHHRKQQSNQRSTAYYRTPSGKTKKERLNLRRSPKPDPEHTRPEPQPADHDRADQHIPATKPDLARRDDSPRKIELHLQGVALSQSDVVNSPMLPYVRLLVRLIDRLELSRAQIVEWLLETMRQHSMSRRSGTDYVLGFLNQHPP